MTHGKSVVVPVGRLKLTDRVVLGDVLRARKSFTNPDILTKGDVVIVQALTDDGCVYFQNLFRCSPQAGLRLDWFDFVHRPPTRLKADYSHMAAAPAPSSLAGGAVFDVEAYVADYEFRGDDGDFTPNAWQRVMLTDAIHGVLAAMPSGQASREVREAIVTAIAFINRDHGTDRLNDTVTALMPKLVRADAILRGQA